MTVTSPKQGYTGFRNLRASGATQDPEVVIKGGIIPARARTERQSGLSEGLGGAEGPGRGAEGRAPEGPSTRRAEEPRSRRGHPEHCHWLGKRFLIGRRVANATTPGQRPGGRGGGVSRPREGQGCPEFTPCLLTPQRPAGKRRPMAAGRLGTSWSRRAPSGAPLWADPVRREAASSPRRPRGAGARQRGSRGPPCRLGGRSWQRGRLAGERVGGVRGRRPPAAMSPLPSPAGLAAERLRCWADGAQSRLEARRF
ncbi:uncharacterized protein LOC111813988 [Octodon degus]|uniref:Uncharacterized protein LOC111813988 n=1 Tax=Octodon degus TaxID=10160 RepID=A0A6P6DR30_OCTDE|nr:uncharacterized protein LOC111813988 [Octodon degus]